MENESFLLGKEFWLFKGNFEGSPSIFWGCFLMQCGLWRVILLDDAPFFGLRI
jgi:hypothetical protein